MHVLFSFFILILISGSAWADTGVLRLEELLSESCERNLRVLAMREIWESERSKISAARTWSDPKAGLNLERIRRNKGPRSKNAATDMYMLEQDIPFPGKLSARAKAQHHKALIARYEYERALLDVQAEVAAAYYDLWELLESIEINRFHSRIWERVSSVSERHYASGRALQRDVLRAQVEADKISIELANLQERIPAARARLNVLLNLSPDSPLGDPAAPSGEFSTPDLASLDSATITWNVDLKAARHHIEHSRFLLKAARLSIFPDFTAGWSRMLEDGMPKFYNASLFLNVPIFFWKQRAEIRAAESEVKHAEYESARMNLEVQSDLRGAVADVRNAARAARVYRGSVLPRSRKALASVESGYLTKQAGFLDLLESERQLLVEELAYVNLLSQYGKARAILDRIVGRAGTTKEMMRHE